MTINDHNDHVVYNVMPHPGQSGALHFDDNNISEFLDDWNLECDDYEYDNEEEMYSSPSYCERTIKDVIKLLPGYISKN